MNNRRLPDSQIIISNAQPQAGVNHGEIEGPRIAVMLYTTAPPFIILSTVEPIFSTAFAPFNDMFKLHDYITSWYVKH